MKQFNKDSIRVLRMTLGLSQDEFAKKAGGTLQRQHISQWEIGTHVPDTSSLLLIVNAFRVPFDIFFVEEMHHSKTELAKVAE